MAIDLLKNDFSNLDTSNRLDEVNKDEHDCMVDVVPKIDKHNLKEQPRISEVYAFKKTLMYSNEIIVSTVAAAITVKNLYACQTTDHSPTKPSGLPKQGIIDCVNAVVESIVVKL